MFYLNLQIILTDGPEMRSNLSYYKKFPEPIIEQLITYLHGPGLARNLLNESCLKNISYPHLGFSGHYQSFFELLAENRYQSLPPFALAKQRFEETHDLGYFIMLSCLGNQARRLFLLRSDRSYAVHYRDFIRAINEIVNPELDLPRWML